MSHAQDDTAAVLIKEKTRNNLKGHQWVQKK